MATVVGPKRIAVATRKRELILLGDEGKVIAGGTTLLILIKHGLFIPQKLINLKKVAGASYVEQQPGQGLRIGALTTIYDVETSPAVRRGWARLPTWEGAERAHPRCAIGT